MIQCQKHGFIYVKNLLILYNKKKKNHSQLKKKTKEKQKPKKYKETNKQQQQKQNLLQNMNYTSPGSQGLVLTLQQLQEELKNTNVWGAEGREEKDLIKMS